MNGSLVQLTAEGNPGKRLNLNNRHSVSFGSGSNCTVILRTDGFKPKHATLTIGEDNKIWLRNLDENGLMVKVNHNTLGSEPVEINHGDRINFENCVCFLYEGDPATHDETDPSADPALGLPIPALAGASPINELLEQSQLKEMLQPKKKDDDSYQYINEQIKRKLGSSSSSIPTPASAEGGGAAGSSSSKTRGHEEGAETDDEEKKEAGEKSESDPMQIDNNNDPESAGSKDHHHHGDLGADEELEEDEEKKKQQPGDEEGEDAKKQHNNDNNNDDNNKLKEEEEEGDEGAAHQPPVEPAGESSKGAPAGGARSGNNGNRRGPREGGVGVDSVGEARVTTVAGGSRGAAGGSRPAAGAGGNPSEIRIKFAPSEQSALLQSLLNDGLTGQVNVTKDGMGGLTFTISFPNALRGRGAARLPPKQTLKRPQQFPPRPPQGAAGGAARGVIPGRPGPGNRPPLPPAGANKRKRSPPPPLRSQTMQQQRRRPPVVQQPLKKASSTMRPTISSLNKQNQPARDVKKPLSGKPSSEDEDTGMFLLPNGSGALTRRSHRLAQQGPGEGGTSKRQRTDDGEGSDDNEENEDVDSDGRDDNEDGVNKAKKALAKLGGGGRGVHLGRPREDIDKRRGVGMTLLWAAEKVLREERRPMKSPEIIKRGREKGYIGTDSKRADNSLVGRFSTSITKDPDSPFVRVSPATYGLKEYLSYYKEMGYDTSES